MNGKGNSSREVIVSGNQELQIQRDGGEGCNFPAKAQRSLRVIEYF
jgi:hypothetical protein